MPNSDKPPFVADEYRRIRLFEAEQFLSGCCSQEIGVEEISRSFARAHEIYPNLSGWIYRNEVPTPRGPGSLEFCELATRAVHMLVGPSGDSDWRNWLQVLLAYLLQKDTQQEFLRNMGSGGIERRAGATPMTYAEVEVEGETYEISHLFKASEHCCSWLRRRFGEVGQSAPADREPEKHSRAPRVSLPKDATVNDPPRKPFSSGVVGASSNPNRLQQAIAERGLTVPKLTQQICQRLRRTSGLKTGVDRSTLYRLIKGETKQPNQAVWMALLEVLKLPDYETVDTMTRPTTSEAARD